MTHNNQNSKILHHSTQGVQKSKGSTLIISFHGYGETAQQMHNRIKNTLSEPSIMPTHLFTPQALSSFLNSKDKLAHSWLSSTNRDLQLQNNNQYMRSLFEQATLIGKLDTVIFIGY